MNNAKIFIVDDDAGVRDALTMFLEASGYFVESFCCARDFLDAINPDAPGCIILDVDMPGMDGPELQKIISQQGIQLPVIFLSGYGTIPITVRVIKAGAVDFLTKPVEGAALLALVRRVLEQGSHQQKLTASHQSILSKLTKLTQREREVLVLAIAGHANKEIGAHLGISYRTVEIHRARILQKTGASNMLELARFAGSLESVQSSTTP